MAYPINNVTYSIIGMSGLGCADSTSIIVNVNPLPIISATTADLEICIGETALISANGGIQYSWQPSNSLNSNIGDLVSAAPTLNTTYMVTGTDANSCSNWDTISILVNPLPILTINTNASTICEGESVSLIAAGGDSYVWSPSLGLNSSLGNSVIANPLVSTNYLVTVTDLNGCSDIISSNIRTLKI